jgi:hypothetical protein
MKQVSLAALIAGTIILGVPPGAQAAMSHARAAAIHECSTAVQRYPETTFSSLEFQLYRACMAAHGQVE